ncbi:MAG: S9 family peptidase [Bryobacteraceae bacterium]
MNKNVSFTIKLALVLCSASACAASQPKIDQLLEELDQTISLSDPSISPNGRWITWTEEDSSGTKHSYLLDTTDLQGKSVRVNAPGALDRSECRGFAWSKDSTRLAFFSNAGTKTGSSQDQIFVMTAAGGACRKLTNLNGYAKDIRWSSDGRQLAFLYAEGGGGPGPLAAEPAAVGEIGAQIHNLRLALVDTEGDGAVHFLTTADLNIYEYDWSRDGKQFAATAAPGPADNNWWIAKLYRVDAGSGEMKVVFSPAKQQQLAVPRFSPDGKRIAFVAGLMSDQGFTGGDVFLIAPGSEAQNMTAGMKMSASSLTWQSDRPLVLSEAVDGGSAISVRELPGGHTETLWKGPNLLHAYGNYPNLALAADGRTAAAIQSSWERPPEVWAGRIGEWRQVTHLNSGQHPQWGRAESIRWTSGPFRVQGWLLYPQNFDPAKRYPMVVEVHGGPAGERAAEWPSSRFDMSVLAGMGYFVFFPNPRGSYGEGEAFTRANIKDFGGGDLRDILAGVDTVIRKAPIDPDRLGITGWSYGGFMTMWTVTQTHRFRAAVAGAGIANWLSYYGENSIDEWMIPYFGASVYNDPAAYAKSSPIDFIKRVKTPTLVLVGERDGECPAPQSFEFWHALQALGVPAKLVVYPGEGHSFHGPKNRLDRMQRTLAWFDQYLGSSTGQ